jgi:hypothetical protein
MKTLKLSVQLSAARFVALVLPFLLFSVCGLAVPHITLTFARWALYLLPAVIVLLLIYCNAVGVRVFVHGLRSQRTLIPESRHLYSLHHQPYCQAEHTVDTSPNNTDAVPGATKVALGVALPGMMLIVFDLWLLGSCSGKGAGLGSAGMMLGAASAIVVPAVFIVNLLIMTRPWRSKIAVLLPGYILPIIAAVKGYLFLYGS